MKFKIYQLWVLFVLLFIIGNLIRPYNIISLFFGLLAVIFIIWNAFAEQPQRLEK